MSKGNPLTAVRLEKNLLEAIDADVFRLQKRGHRKETSRSSWIRGAIIEKLAHRQRSRRKKSADSFRCCRCGVTLDLQYLAWTRELLTGDKESCCHACDR